MKIIYAGVGAVLFSIEMFLYEWSVRLMLFWYAHKQGLGLGEHKLGDFCKNMDTATPAKCLDFRWDSFVQGIGMLGIKIVVLIVFFILLKNKKVGNAISLISTYSLFMLGFILHLIPIRKLYELNDSMGYGIFALIFTTLTLIIISVVTLMDYKIKNFIASKKV